MSHISSETSKVVLRTQDDWQSWDRQFKTQAIDLHLWDHISHDEPLHPMPQRPQLADFQRQGPSRGQSQGVQTRAGRSHTIDDDDSQPNELSDSRRIAYQMDIQLYIEDNRRFDKQEKAVQTLRKWIIDTVAPHYGEVACLPGETLYQWYHNLKKHAGITDSEGLQLAHKRYRESVKPLTKFKDWSAWLVTWEKAILLAEQKKVPEALSTFVWTDDFLSAVTPIAGNWASMFRMVYKMQIEKNELSFRDLANDFRKHMGSIAYPSRKGTTLNVAKGAFGPAYAGQDPPDQGTLEDAQESAGVASVRRSKRRAPEEEEMSSAAPCMACDQSHSLSKCYYIFPDKAPEWWEENPKVRASIDKRLNDNLILKERIQGLKGKRSRSGTPRGSRSRRSRKEKESRSNTPRRAKESRSNTPRRANESQDQDQHPEPEE
jgi:hypothetical protein